MRRNAVESSADRIGRAARQILSETRPLDEWSLDTVEALRRLVGAREAALLVSSEEQQFVRGDERPAAFLRDVPVEGIGSGYDADPVATLVERGDDGRWPDRLRVLRRLDDVRALVGVCCTFGRVLSRRGVAIRLSLLHAVMPALEAEVRIRLERRVDRAALRAMLLLLDVGAALYTRGGVLCDANAPLLRLLREEDGHEPLRWWMSHLARTVESRPAGQPSAPEEAIRLPLAGHPHRLRARLLHDAHAADDACVLLLVEPVAATTASPIAAGDAALLRDRFRLTERECEVARLLQLGYSNAEVAGALDISPNTARHHTERVFMKLGVRARSAIHRVLADARREHDAPGPPRPPAAPPSFDDLSFRPPSAPDGRRP